MGSTLVTRQAEERLERQRDELVKVSGDVDAFMWEVEEALREARHGNPDANALQQLSVRAASVLAAVDLMRSQLPPRLEHVVKAQHVARIDPGAVNYYDTHRYMK